ncbi:hypothetical protein DCS_03371 [Drechmeria coniospora]|uniref:Tetratricopeptide-like helical n=1 Tax=Drechmeria coniospora TaxID=98403 RepID=A0A151GH64_DRECN|nr:hypothetical protein DCS_03371 [Drechmeria coniospora]KYK56371.1 hypothetical protein DCS_03371 [Drechmeria coniospora]ODA76823.1 hypothetical protein RJ55_07339 [Drechmeria coniospora]
MSQPSGNPPKSHTRNKSSLTRGESPQPVGHLAVPLASAGSTTLSRPRPSTKGPVDDRGDPLASSSTPRQSTSSPSPGGQQSRRSGGGHVAQPDVVPLPLPDVRPKDFSFLLRPDIYHPLTQLDVPLAFRNSPKRPDPSVPLEELLRRGQFRAAAVAAVQQLTTSTDPHDYERIFGLLYTRLVCLTLIDATPLAAQEVKALEDLNDAPTYIDEGTGEHLVPWELRVLNVRLQSLGFGDPRRAVMSYHELAREARAHAAKAGTSHDDAARELWKARLHDLGIKVAGALIEMDDPSGATHHLAGLRDGGDGTLGLSKALLWLQLGDVGKARGCATATRVVDTERLILALCDMADAEYESALEKWRSLQQSFEGDEMVGVNTAVCLLYLGRIHEGRELLEGLVDGGYSSHSLLFNLSTMYELCSEKNRNLKVKLADRVAAMAESPTGWERTNADFKL